MASGDQPTLGLRERKKAKARATIQQQALRLFRKQGYNATTVEQIADAAEVSPSTFFRYFPTKEDVVLSDEYDPLLIEAFHEQPVELSPVQAFRNALVHVFSRLNENDFEVIRERTELILAVPDLRAAAINSLNMHMMAELLASRVGRNPGDRDVQMFVGAVIGVCMSVTFYWMEHPDEDFITLLVEGLAYLDAGLPL